MSQVLKLVVVGIVVLTSALIASAQDRMMSSKPQSALNSFAQSPVPSGPYVAPSKKAEPRKPVLPYTWEEKRYFDYASGGDDS